MSSGDVVAVKGVDTGIGAGLLASIALGNGGTYTSGSSWKCTPTLFSGWSRASGSGSASQAPGCTSRLLAVKVCP